jgi:hypothetical protein
MQEWTFNGLKYQQKENKEDMKLTGCPGTWEPKNRQEVFKEILLKNCYES